MKEAEAMIWIRELLFNGFPKGGHALWKDYFEYHLHWNTSGHTFVMVIP